MPKSTFEEESKNQRLNQGAFPTFRAIPSGLAKLGRNCRRRWHYLLGIIVIITIAYSVLDIYATVQLNHQLSLIRQKGEPLTSAETAPPEISDSQNAAIIYERAAKALKLSKRHQQSLQSLNPKEQNAILTKNTVAINLIRQATEKSECRFDVDWNHPFTLLIPEAVYMRQLASLLSWQASKEATSGNMNSALQDVKRIYVMAGHLSNDPFTISAIVAGSIETIANNTLAKVLLHSSLSESQASVFNTSTPIINWQKVWCRSLITERTYSLEVFRSPSQVISMVGQNRASFPRLSWLFWQALPPLRKLDEMCSLRIWREILDNESKPRPPFSKMSSDNIDKEVMQTPWYAMGTKLLLPFGTFFHERSNRSYVQRCQREIALALAVYHTKYHQYPTTLAPAEKLWKSTFPLDPYNNKPFHYKSDGKTFLLYSVGLNGVDDGGKWMSGSSPENDIVWGH